MKVLVFGATGGVGQHVVRLLREAGHEVTAFVRTPEKLEYRDGVSVCQGNAFDLERVTQALEGQEAVISCLSSSTPLKPSDELERMTANIISGMRAHGVTRLTYCASAGVDNELTGAIGKAVQWMLRHALDDHRRALEHVRSAGIDWTIARPTSLVDAPFDKSYREAENGLPPRPRPIPRASVADFLVKSVTESARCRHASIGLAI